MSKLGRIATAVAIAAGLLASPQAIAETATRVFLNGIPTPVYFNDGDSFRVLAGRHLGTKARLAGFNTLESYGNVHQWGTWTREELAHFAKLGTYNARRGVWHCTSSDLKTDTYGRILWWCQDLAVDQVRKGLAHAMTVTDKPAHPALVAAQKEAIAARRGMWAHGVPEFVLTSLHAANEGYAGRTYNRLVSSADGHSQKWRHNEAYLECQTACQPSADPDDAKIAAYVVELRADAGVKARLGAYSDAELRALLGDYVQKGRIGAMKSEDDRFEIEKVLSRAVAVGRLRKSGKPVSCMVYAPFQRRYGDAKAKCL